MIILKDDSDKILWDEIQERVNAFIDKIPKINWYRPSKDLKQEDIDKQINFILECFWIKAWIEYKKLTTQEDWDSARLSSFWSTRPVIKDSIWDSARDSVLDYMKHISFDLWLVSARYLALNNARDASWSYSIPSYRSSSWYCSCAAQEILLQDNEQFKSKYPNWAFRQLFKLWEMWLYPVWIIWENKKFTVYVPPSSFEFPENLIYS